MVFVLFLQYALSLLFLSPLLLVLFPDVFFSSVVFFPTFSSHFRSLTFPFLYYSWSVFGPSLASLIIISTLLPCSVSDMAHRPFVFFPFISLSLCLPFTALSYLFPFPCTSFFPFIQFPFRPSLLFSFICSSILYLFVNSVNSFILYFILFHELLFPLWFLFLFPLIPWSINIFFLHFFLCILVLSISSLLSSLYRSSFHLESYPPSFSFNSFSFCFPGSLISLVFHVVHCLFLTSVSSNSCPTDWFPFRFLFASILLPFLHSLRCFS